MDESHSESESIMSFFLMPGEAIALLHFQLYSVVGEAIAENILYKYGKRCGRSTTDKLQLPKSDMSRIPALLSQIWAELGFGRMSAEYRDKKIVISIRDGIESSSLGYRAKPSCHFTKGYLAGMISSLMDENVDAREIMCSTMGGDECVFEVEKTI